MYQSLKLSCLFLISCFLFFACGNEPQANDENKTETVAEAPAAPVVPEKTLAEKLRGSWVNFEDKKDILFFSGDDLIRIYDGKMKDIVKPAFQADCTDACLKQETLTKGEQCIVLNKEEGDSECLILRGVTPIQLTCRYAGVSKISTYRKQ